LPTKSGSIGARLDRLPASRAIWTRVILLSLGGFFEFYDIFFTGYIAPALIRSGIFGTRGIAAFIAAMFSGLFIGTGLFGFVADRFGRRAIFTFSLLWYTAASIVMSFQHTGNGLLFWRFLAGIGVGIELVTIDTYLAELVPRKLRGRAFAYNQTIQFSSVPLIALLAWLLVPRAPFGIDGWRWVVLTGAIGAIFVWWIRRRLPESPRWLAEHGRVAEADAILSELEARIELETGAALAHPMIDEPPRQTGRFGEIWIPPYRRRTIMMIVFNLFQTVGYYGFSNWVPTLLTTRGIAVTTSLRYTFLIAIAAPFGPLLASTLADKLERKWQIVLAAFGIAFFGVLFGRLSLPPLLIALGVMVTLSANVLSFSSHAYQAEIFPTRIRALAVGFTYSWSRFSVIFSSFAIAFFLDRFGVPGVFAFIAGSMVVVMISIGLLGPRTNNLALESISS
jgi:MFS transporter, putative metabolite:H+ symporter